MRKVWPVVVGTALLCGANAVAQDTSISTDVSRPLDTKRGMPQLPPAEFDEGLDIGGEEIEARKLRSRMTVQVSVNGQGPHKFVVDSGADTSVVGEKLAAKLGLPNAGPTMLHGMTESKVVDRVRVSQLTLGPTVTTDLELPVLDERDIGADGMIGLDALVEQRLMIDFEKRHITVDDAFEPPPYDPNEIVVRGRLNRGQLILTEVRAGMHRVNAVIDTGSEVTIGNLALRDKLIGRHGDDLEMVEITGVTGARTVLSFAVIPRLRLGPVVLQNIPIAFADLPPFEVFGLNDTPALLLGTDLMETFRRVSLDFHNRKARFQLKKCEPNTTRIRTTSQAASRIRAVHQSACTQ